MVRTIIESSLVTWIAILTSVVLGTIAFQEVRGEVKHLGTSVTNLSKTQTGHQGYHDQIKPNVFQAFAQIKEHGNRLESLTQRLESLDDKQQSRHNALRVEVVKQAIAAAKLTAQAEQIHELLLQMFKMLKNGNHDR